MKKFFTSISVVILLLDYSFAQAPDTLWTKTYGGGSNDRGYFIQQTFDNGYIVVGETFSFGAGGGDTWLIKVNSIGDTMWTKTYGGSDYDVGWSVIQTSDEGYILIGTTYSYGMNGDLWVIKTDSYGNILWSKIYGGAEEDVGSSIQKTTDGGYIILGTTSSFGNGNSDVWLLKIDSFGDTLWTRTYGDDQYQSGESIIQLNDNGCFIIYRNSAYGNRDFGLIKTDSLGKLIWSKYYGGTDDEWPFDGLQTADSGVVIVGRTFSYGAGNSDVWMVKTDESGDTLWTKTYGGINGEAGSSILQTPDSSYIILGGTSSFGFGNYDLWLIRTNMEGDTIWTKTMGGNGSDWGYSIQETTDGGYIIAGETKSFGAGQSDFWIIKLAPATPSNIESYENFIPSVYVLSQNFPNPFNPSTKISWRLPVGSHQTLKIYDVLGNEIATLVDEYKPSGSYEVEWDASGLPSGIYFYQLRAEDFVETKKMILMK